MFKKLKLKDFYLAQKRIQGLVRRTALEFSPFFSAYSGGEVYLKLENLQITGSYKPRGVLNKMLQMEEEQRIKGVVTASTGNHAQGVAFASKMLGVNASIVVPIITPKTKIEAIKRYGAELLIYGKGFDESEIKAHEKEREFSKVYISAYNDYDLIAGQGTIALEILDDKIEFDIILVPVAAGALLSGIATVFKCFDPGVQVFGVQTKASPVMYQSFKKGARVEIPIEKIEPTIAESLLGGFEKESVTFDIIMEYVDDIILVGEDDIKKAIVFFLEHHHQVVEGAGAVGLAALLTNNEKFKGKKIGVIISGGNIDISLLREILLEQRGV